MELPSFSTVRADRDNKACRKRRGGELAIYMNTRWCNHGHVSIKISSCYRDIEILAVSFLPYYNRNTGNVGKFFIFYLNKIKTKRLSNHMSQYFIHNRTENITDV